MVANSKWASDCTICSNLKTPENKMYSIGFDFEGEKRI